MGHEGDVLEVLEHLDPRDEGVHRQDLHCVYQESVLEARRAPGLALDARAPADADLFTTALPPT